MKTINNLAFVTLSLFVCSLFLVSCSQGVQKDLNTGLKMSYSGISVEDSYLTVDGEKYISSKIPLGKEVVVVLEDVSGLKMQDGIYTILFETEVTDIQGNYLLQYSDTLVEPEVDLLRSLLTLAEPMATGQTYQWISTFSDLNGEGFVKASIDLAVVE